MPSQRHNTPPTNGVENPKKTNIEHTHTTNNKIKKNFNKPHMKKMFNIKKKKIKPKKKK